MAALAAVVCLSSACEDRYASERSFLRKTKEERQRAFAELPPERRVRVFMATRVEDPGDLTLCRELGKRADVNLPLVLAALANEAGEQRDDREKRALIAALSCVAAREGAPCDPRLSPIAHAAAKTIFDKATRDDAVRAANELRCTR